MHINVLCILLDNLLFSSFMLCNNWAVLTLTLCLVCSREQRQKDSVKMPPNSFPRDMDYRQEALQDKATTSKLFDPCFLLHMCILMKL